MGLPEGQEWVYFDLACHAGTWLALALFLRKEIWQVLCDWKKIALFTGALFPLLPAYFFLKPFSTPQYTGYFLLLTAAILFLISRKPGASYSITHEKKWTSVLFIGMMQGIALLPGISRSGATIAAARICRWEWIEAVRFSFLLSIPTILGGEVLESWKLLKNSEPAISLLHCGLGLIASFTVGLFTVRFVFWMYERKKVRPFAWYCLGFGLLMIWILHER
jgi:undecaprenyl-diphosphatase